MFKPNHSIMGAKSVFLHGLKPFPVIILDTMDGKSSKAKDRDKIWNSADAFSSVVG